MFIKLRIVILTKIRWSSLDSVDLADDNKDEWEWAAAQAEPPRHQVCRLFQVK